MCWYLFSFFLKSCVWKKRICDFLAVSKAIPEIYERHLCMRKKIFCVYTVRLFLKMWYRILEYILPLMFIGPCIIVMVEEQKTNLTSLAILFHFLCAQHVSDINISIITSLRLCCWITTSVVLFSVCCVLEIWCGRVCVVSVLQAEACNTDTTQTQPWGWRQCRHMSKLSNRKNA